MRLIALLSIVCTSLAASPTFRRDVIPILQKNCQQCHRSGEIGPMPLITYSETRPWAKAIREAVVTRKMPPWFAVPGNLPLANQPTLTPIEIETISAWVAAGAPEGRHEDAPPPRKWPTGWNIGTPDAIYSMPAAIAIPAGGELDYQYAVVPTHLTESQWVQRVELRPGDRTVVHHAIVYIREPGSTWKRGPTKSDILFTYTPGNGVGEWPEGMAKRIPPGSDLVFQMHYTPGKRPTHDQSSIGVVVARTAPTRRVLTLQLNDDKLFIPPGHPDFQVRVSGTMPGDALLLSFLPHMHLRGRAFEYALYDSSGNRRTLLRVDPFNFFWQLTYRLQEPLPLAAGTRLECVATYDNSRRNPNNPDPDVMVRYGEQTHDEMLVGFFDVAVPVGLDKFQFFSQRRLR